MIVVKPGARAASRSAFTLLEVLIVMAIIVIIVSMGSVYVFRQYADAKRAAAKIGAENLAAACMRYKVQMGSLPENLEQLVTPPDGRQPFVEPQALRDPWGGAYVYEPQGQRNGGRKPDIYARDAENNGSEVGNFD